jgi:hypothetical protein
VNANVSQLPREVKSFADFDLDTVFASQTLSDRAYGAAQETIRKFDSAFPGWQLYRRIVAGVDAFDRDLEAWAIWMARGVVRAQRANGRPMVFAKVRARPGWIAQAGRDGLDYAIFQRYAEGVNRRAARFGVDSETYLRVRDTVAGGMTIGLNTFRAQLHAEYMRLILKAKTDNAKFRG